MGGGKHVSPVGETAPTYTVVSMFCSHCNGGGNRRAGEGIPGVPYQQGNSCQRVVCRDHAKGCFCMSCSSVTGFESYQLDRAALEDVSESV